MSKIQKAMLAVLLVLVLVAAFTNVVSANCGNANPGSRVRACDVKSGEIVWISARSASKALTHGRITFDFSACE